MILDKRLEFCDAVALNTGGAGSYLLGDQVDTGGGLPLTDGGNDGDGLYFVITGDTTATSGGSATGQFHLCSDDSASIATNGTATYHISTAAIPVATLVAGYYVCKVELPKGVYERYLGVLQTTAVAAFTAGKINAFLTNDPYTVRAFPNATGDTISL